jgi:hypothetical protein
MAWIIVLAVLVFLFLLTLFRLKFELVFDGTARFKIRYLFITVRMNKQKTGKAKKEKKQPKKPQKPEKEKPKPDIAKIIGMIRRYSEVFKDAGSSLRRRLRIDRLTVKLIIGEEDAAKTAIFYGQACAVIYPAVAGLCGLVKVKEHDVNIAPDFNGGQSEASVGCVISMRVLSLIAGGASDIIKLIRITVRENRSINKSKDGAVK